jgi:hypothetical protein
MAKFVLVYTGGGSMGDSPEEQQKMMEAWMNWFGSLGDSIVDMGSPFGPPSTVASDGSVRAGGSTGLSGYSIIEAATVDEATSKAKGCPVLAGGGAVEVYESLPVG